MVLDLVQALGQPSYSKLIVPHTPYDLDGVCSAYALGKLLSSYGHEVKIWLPHTPPTKFVQVINTVTGTNEHPLLHVGYALEEQETYNESLITDVASYMLNNYKIIIVDKSGPDKIFPDDSELQEAFIRTLERFGKQGDIIVIDHHEIQTKYDGIMYYVSDQYCANSFWMFEVIVTFLENINGVSDVDCSIFSLLSAGILSDTLLLRSCNLSANEYKILYKLSYYLESCGDSLGRVMDVVSGYHKDSTYYDLYELVRRKVYAHNLVPDLAFIVISHADLWATLEAYSLKVLSRYVGNLSIDLLSEFSGFNAVCMLFEDIQKNSIFVAINAKKHIDLSSLRRSWGARGRKNYLTFNYSGSIEDIVGQVIRAWRSYAP
jgi:nanoRNase/pAp phosphatase (c-di-AMP/oligoRNAs hydrolase)